VAIATKKILTLTVVLALIINSPEQTGSDFCLGKLSHNCQKILIDVSLNLFVSKAIAVLLSKKYSQSKKTFGIAGCFELLFQSLVD
jgi:hypothetical protein